MEDWQEWQIRADQVAASLRQDLETLEQNYLSEGSDGDFRGFWPRFKDLKERVRIAPAIKLDDKLQLERGLRDLGSRAYKGQEASYAQSALRKTELLESIGALKASSEGVLQPRELRIARRDLDTVRSQFDAGPPLMPQDRQAVWDAWKDASQFVWDRLNSQWSENEQYLRDILDQARSQIESRNPNAVRQTIGKFFEALRTREARQSTITAMKAEANELRNEASAAEAQRTPERVVSQQPQLVSPVDSWKQELERNREAITPVSDEVAALEQQMLGTPSILEQAMLRGTLVDKRRRLQELERATRVLEQRIRATEETPLISAS